MLKNFTLSFAIIVVYITQSGLIEASCESEKIKNIPHSLHEFHNNDDVIEFETLQDFGIDKIENLSDLGFDIHNLPTPDTIEKKTPTTKRKKTYKKYYEMHQERIDNLKKMKSESYYDSHNNFIMILENGMKLTYYTDGMQVAIYKNIVSIQQPKSDIIESMIKINDMQTQHTYYDMLNNTRRSIIIESISPSSCATPPPSIVSPAQTPTTTSLASEHDSNTSKRKINDMQSIPVEPTNLKKRSIKVPENIDQIVAQLGLIK